MKKMKFFMFLFLAALVVAGCKEDEDGVVSELDMGLLEYGYQYTWGAGGHYEFYSDGLLKYNEVSFEFDEEITAPGTYSIENGDFIMDSFDYKDVGYWEDDGDYTLISGTLKVTAMNGDDIQSATFSIKINMWGKIVTLYGAIEDSNND